VPVRACVCVRRVSWRGGSGVNVHACACVHAVRCVVARRVANRTQRSRRNPRRCSARPPQRSPLQRAAVATHAVAARGRRNAPRCSARRPVAGAAGDVPAVPPTVLTQYPYSTHTVPRVAGAARDVPAVDQQRQPRGEAQRARASTP
jgi:hypothetical protein